MECDSKCPYSFFSGHAEFSFVWANHIWLVQSLWTNAWVDYVNPIITKDMYPRWVNNVLDLPAWLLPERHRLIDFGINLSLQNGQTFIFTEFSLYNLST